MFGSLTYLGYTLLFCVPPLLLIWLREEFSSLLRPRLKAILFATLAMTLYGSLIWPMAVKYGLWTYDPGKHLPVKVAGYVWIDDVIWWFLVSLLIASALILSMAYERRGVNLFQRELSGFFRSVANAVEGLRIIRKERNSTIHVAVATFVVLEAILLQISTVEWIVVCLLIAVVIALELVNTAIERLATVVQPGHDKAIAQIKDTAAAAVLVASLAAVVIGFMIFFSRMWRLLAV